MLKHCLLSTGSFVPILSGLQDDKRREVGFQPVPEGMLKYYLPSARSFATLQDDKRREVGFPIRSGITKEG